MEGQLLWEVLDKHWYLSNGACKVYKVASTFAITSSNYMLVAIAIDRHEAVVRPLNPFISAKNLVLAAWAVSLLPSLPNLFIFLSDFMHLQKLMWEIRTVKIVAINLLTSTNPP
ncbi:Vasopressin V2 receptor [Portunus trituberculatus]|uniref:Vasopressin V2 receptor n=1 Tax=Portunus trituberculatus TaxID=210409 RepID=A0A5B7EUB3_PORTR|nr:Vasopressin V2 receptor [Portunus trituberculatus]